MHEGVTASPLATDPRRPAAPARAGGAAARARPRSLRVNFSWTLAGNVTYSFANQGILILLARLASPAVVGVYGLATAVTTPIITFSNLKLRAVQATDARREYRFGHYFSVRLIASAIALLVILGLLPLQRREVVPVLLLLGIAKAFESLSDVYYGVLQQHERMDYMARSLMLKGPLSLVAMVTAYFFTHSLAWGVGAVALTWAGLMLAYDAPNARRVLHETDPTAPTLSLRQGCYSFLAPIWDWPRMRQLFWISLPLGFTVTTGALQKQLPRYFLAHYGGMHQLGIFTAVAGLLGGGNLVVNSLALTVSPRLSQLYADGDRAGFQRLIWKLMGVGAALGAAGVGVALLIGKPLLSFLYGSEYARHPWVFVWLMAAAGVDYLYLFWGSAVSAMRRFGVQLPIHLGALAVIAGASAWFLPRVGLIGAAYGIFCGSSFCLLAYIFVACLVLRNTARKDESGGAA